MMVPTSSSAKCHEDHLEDGWIDGEDFSCVRGNLFGFIMLLKTSVGDGCVPVPLFFLQNEWSRTTCLSVSSNYESLIRPIHIMELL